MTDKTLDLIDALHHFNKEEHITPEEDRQARAQVDIIYVFCGHLESETSADRAARARAQGLIESLRTSLNNGLPFGVTIQGNRLTLRWGGTKQMHAVILDVEERNAPVNGEPPTYEMV